MIRVNVKGMAGVVSVEDASYTMDNLESFERNIVTFENGYGASIVEHRFSYGTELAVLDKNGAVTYDTPITDDVLGYLDDETLREALDAIAALPSA